MSLDSLVGRVDEGLIVGSIPTCTHFLRRGSDMVGYEFILVADSPDSSLGRADALRSDVGLIPSRILLLKARE